MAIDMDPKLLEKPVEDENIQVVCKFWVLLNYCFLKILKAFYYYLPASENIELA